MEQVDLNAQVDYRPNNRVMECKRCQTIQHPPANGSTFDKNSPFMMFRIQNTGNTFIDPDKTRLNFKYKAKDVVGNGATGAAAVSCKNALGAQVTNATNNYNVALSAAGVSGFFSRIEVRVGGSTIESINSYSDIVRLFQVAQVKQSTTSGLMSLTEGLMSDTTGVGFDGNTVAGNAPFVVTRGSGFAGANIDSPGIYLNTAAAAPPTAFHTFDASFPVLSAVLGAGCGKYFPLCLLRSPLEVYFYLESDEKKVIMAKGNLNANANAGNSWSKSQAGYTSANYSITDANLELGLVVFGEDSMDLIRSQIDDTMRIQWSGNQVDGIIDTTSYIKGNTEIIVPGCNYRNLKSIFMVQKDNAPTGTYDPAGLQGFGLKSLQYSIEGRLYPKVAMGSENDAPASITAKSSIFARYLMGAINRTSADLQSGSIQRSPNFNNVNLPGTGFGYNAMGGLGNVPTTAVQLSQEFAQYFTQSFVATTTSPAAGDNVGFAELTRFATGYSFCDFSDPMLYRQARGVDTSRAFVTMRLSRYAGGATYVTPIKLVHVPLFEVSYVLDLETGILVTEV